MRDRTDMTRNIAIITLSAFFAFAIHNMKPKPFGWWPLHDFSSDIQISLTSIWKSEDLMVEPEKLFTSGIFAGNSSPTDACFVFALLSTGISVFYWDMYLLVPI